MRLRNGVLKLFGLCVLAGVLVAGMAFPAAGALGVISNRAGDAVNRISTELLTEQPPLVTTVTDRAGNPIAYLYAQYRTPATSDQISDTMKAAMVAIEDQRFYEHEGVDWPGTMRAFVSNQVAGRITQGASTITQQYVKNYLVHVTSSGDPVKQAEATEQTVARKLREIRVALQLEKRLSKEEILTRYLNVVPYGNRIYGIAAASHAYFGTTPDQLTIAQAALLAGVVNRPGSLNPVTQPKEALFRRGLVIDAMADQHRITQQAAREAKAAPLGIEQPVDKLPNGCVGAGARNGFFCKYVENYLQRTGFSVEQLRRGGYTIRTTLDQRITAAAKKSAEEGVPKDSEQIANVMSVVEPGQDKHRVRALVANRDFGFDKEEGDSAYALPSSMAPPGAGSVYKTFTAAAALEKGMGIKDVVPAPGSYTSKKFSNGTNPYTVGNAEGVGAGSRTIQEALATSPNTAFVILEERAGLDNTVDMAARLGMRRTLKHHDLAGVPMVADRARERTQAEEIKQRRIGAFTLGFSPTSPLELANVSATITSGGVWCPPTPIKEIRDRHGNRVAITEKPCEQAVDRELADAMAVGMSDDTTSGTATRAASSAGWSRPTAAKTGTTETFGSAAFIGATPQLAGAVLTYIDRPESPGMGICLGSPPTVCGSGNIYGGTIPAKTWMRAMKTAHEGLPVVELPSTTERYRHGGSGKHVPEVVDMPVDKAAKKLREAGYEVERRTVSSSDSEGTVISQSPRGIAEGGTSVLLSVSSGYIPPPRTVAEKSPSEAEASAGDGGGDGEGGGSGSGSEGSPDGGGQQPPRTSGETPGGN
ncbi:penicillin-binding protein [Actinopolyspora erythraea]|uniref:Penicillin-binding protein n=1 Tax=Actinopolyspora erythraea TaxID=414996 RepID=A0A099DBJ2_9ACTN|nr:transglycosylase domain-containing protein [Actinopolyspora erythraea]ASU77182.1 penicillin-binding protein [Actinopolyspora erythraea]KGI83127.1 penicillin-binding protein [Actinopolyspora erythraea]